MNLALPLKIFLKSLPPLPGVNIIDSEGFASEDIDFKTQLIKIRGAKVDSIFFVGLVKQFANVLKQARDLGIQAQSFKRMVSGRPAVIG